MRAFGKLGASILTLCLMTRLQAAAPGTEGIEPQSPDQALKNFHTKPGLKVELVAAEPLVQSPVAIDWAADGKLWVCEMADYPMGADGNWKPGGRVKFLEDTNNDGRYDKATLFLHQLPFPTGVTAWGRGVFICAAPDILYAADTNNDGKADKIEKLFTGFATDNYQARVNSLSLGLDNWIYGANGLLGGVIEPVKNSRFPSTNAGVDIRNRDFRFHPITGVFEPVSGLTQQGRVRDDWDNWFGNNNSQQLLAFPYPDRYFARNPNAPAPNPIRSLPDSNRLFPTSRLLERFNDPEAANRVTAGCGLGLYRDTLLGEEFYGNAFTCEPVHNLVHRQVIAPDLTSSHRAADEQKSEFLSSTDNWFRPVQARTGPDGGLYVVDMYRFLIEHPRWIPAARLAQLNVRAGSDKGRIYRVVKNGGALRPVRDLTKLSATQLTQTLNSPNGTERDRVHIQLLQTRPAEAAGELRQLAAKADLPQVRVQALSALDAIQPLDAATISTALKDKDEHVRAHAIRLAEPLVKEGLDLILAALQDSSPLVARQLAFSLGESDDPRAAEALIALEKKWSQNSEIVHAIVSSAKPTVRPSKTARAVVSRPIPKTQPTSAAREQILAEYKSVATLNGSPEKGAEVFAANCAACHQFNGAGHNVGPDLAPLRGKDVDYFVKNILDPNAAIEPRFVSYSIDLEDDRSLTGIIRVETANNMTVVSGNGVTVSVPRAEIIDVRPSALSMMPEGLEQAINPQQMADLIAYIHSGTTRKIARGNDPKPVAPADGVLILPASRAEIFGGDITFEETFQNIGMWHGADDYIVWTAHVHDSGAYDIYLDYASAASAAGNHFRLTIGKQSLKGAIPTTGNDWSNYKQIRVGEITIPAGTHRITFRPDGPIRNALIDLRAIALTPIGKKPQWPQPAAPIEEQVLRDAPSVGRFILDTTKTDAAREAAINSNPQFSAALITELTRDLTGNSKEEYTRIPWIWRVALACGKRNDAKQIASVLNVSLPKQSEPLRHWQAVVIGGGIINGLSQRDVWPNDRIEEILKSNKPLRERWIRSLELAAAMADDESVPTGTRYDALRMIAMQPWEKSGDRLTKYLKKGTNAELQMGAVSGLADMKSSNASAALRGALHDLGPANRDLAQAGLKRLGPGSALSR